MSLFIDIHILQTLPPSNPNRDDTGAPKSATFGGVSRMRISSQAIKRAVREDFEVSLEPSLRGVRSNRIPLILKKKILEARPNIDVSTLANMVSTIIAWTYLGHKDSNDKRAKFLKEVKANPERAFKEVDALWFVSSEELDSYVDAILEDAEQENIGKAFKSRSFCKTSQSGDQSVAVALFGRMVAGNVNLNIDAACQVAHAIGVGAVERDYDYYTAVDDEKRQDEEAGAGAGMIGTIEFASATVYRYATINVELLRENLGDEAVAEEAIKLFVDSFVRSMPTGKITTFANRTLPEAVLVQVREDQPINLAAAFEDPIVAKGRGFAAPAIKRFVEFESQLRKLTGMAPVSSIVSWTTPRGADFDALGDQVPLAELGEATVEAVRAQATNE